MASPFYLPTSGVTRVAGVLTALPAIVMVAILTAVRWHFPVAWICISLTMSEWYWTSSHLVGLISLGLYLHRFVLFGGQRGALKAVVRCFHSPVLQALPQLGKQQASSGRSHTSGMGGKAHVPMVMFMAGRVYQRPVIMYTISSNIAALPRAEGRGDRGSELRTQK